MKLKTLFLIIITSLFGTVNANELYNDKFYGDDTKTFEIYSSVESMDFLEDEYLYSVAVVLDRRCTPQIMDIMFFNLDEEVNPRNKYDKATAKLGTRIISNKLHTFIKNTTFFFEIPSNLLYSLRSTKFIELELDFQENNLKIPLKFELDPKKRDQVISDIRNCRPS